MSFFYTLLQLSVDATDAKESKFAPTLALFLDFKMIVSYSGWNTMEQHKTIYNGTKQIEMEWNKNGFSMCGYL